MPYQFVEMVTPNSHKQNARIAGYVKSGRIVTDGGLPNRYVPARGNPFGSKRLVYNVREDYQDVARAAGMTVKRQSK